MLLIIVGLLIVVAICCAVWPDRVTSTDLSKDTPLSSKRRPVVPASTAFSIVETVSPVENDVQEEIPEEIITAPPALELQRGKLSWEIRIDTLLAQNIPNSTKAELLLKELPSMPAEAYGRLVQESLDRLSDKDYTSVALPILLNPGTDGAAETVLYADLLERPDGITLPSLLAIARTPGHLFAQSAKETLALLLERDFGTDWGQWEAAVSERLSPASAGN